MTRIFASALLTAASWAASLTDNNVFTGTDLFPSSDIHSHAAEFDFDKSFINNTEFQVGVQIQADEYIAIEAFSRKSRQAVWDVKNLEIDAVGNQKYGIALGQKLDSLVTGVGANKRQIKQNTGALHDNSVFI